MNLSAALNAYVVFNLFLALGWAALVLLKISPSLKLRFTYTILPIFILIPLSLPWFPKEGFTNSTVKVWAGRSMAHVGGPETEIGQVQPGSFVELQEEALPEMAYLLALALLVLGSGIHLLRLMRDLQLLRRLRRDSMLMRKYKDVEIRIHDGIEGPFSFWLPGRFLTLIPSTYLADEMDLRVALRHELQHHRQGDTLWAYPIALLKVLCPVNPFSYLLVRTVGEIQEEACDEQVLKTKTIPRKVYAGCLLKAAETAISRRTSPVCAAGLCFDRGQSFLKRRIKMMSTEHRSLPRWLCRLGLLAFTATLTLTAFAARNLVLDRRIPMEEARLLAQKASENSDFPVVMNEDVLEQLNRFVGTPDGRSFFKASLERKREYDEILSATTKKYNTPYELNAIPIVESGYRNLPSRTRHRSAGLWMFVPGTARKYGMKVQYGLDERLDVVKETDAAHRYLLANKLLFDDWALAVFAYNVGEGAVERGIRRYRTRDVWELSKRIRGDWKYMAKVMAAVIIMKNPELLD